MEDDLITTKEVGDYRIKVYYCRDSECPITNWGLFGSFFFEYSDMRRLHDECNWKTFFYDNKHDLRDVIDAIVMKHIKQKDIVKYLKKGEANEMLVDALKASKEPKAKEYLKRFFGIEEKPKYEFKPFDKVLVRDEDDKEWHISLFAREIVDDYNGLPYKYECSNGTLWDCCIPFEGNEYLLGTDENPEK